MGTAMITDLHNAFEPTEPFSLQAGGSATSVTLLLGQLLTFHINCKLVTTETHIQEKFLSITKDQMVGKPGESWAKAIVLNGTQSRPFKSMH